MSGRLFLFDPADRFIVGTVGMPGERTFFIQARSGGRLISVSLEKAQVAALADRKRLRARRLRSPGRHRPLQQLLKQKQRRKK